MKTAQGDEQSGPEVQGESADLIPQYSVHFESGYTVSESLKNEIISGQYIDISLLLDNRVSIESSKFAIFSELILKPGESKIKITSVER